jgi:hypothetical protein
MPDDAKRKAVKAAQNQFDRESAATQKMRRKAFAQAQKEGYGACRWSIRRRGLSIS